jgi:3-oxoadipate enol-lactonase
MIERDEGYLNVPDGESIWFESAGSGRPLFLAHGLGGNAAVWYQQVPFFAAGYRVITWDQRGFGRSSNLSGKVGPVSAAADQLALMDNLGIDSAHLVGQSMGGWAMLGAALSEPDRVRSLVLACTTAGIPPIDESPLDIGPIGAPHGVRPLGVHPAIGERLPAIDPARAYLYQTLGTFGDRPPDAEFARMLSDTRYDPAALGRLDVPTLFICGSEDTVMTPARVRDASGRLPISHVVELVGRGHSPYFEDPEGWNAVVGEFLDSVEAS